MAILAVGVGGAIAAGAVSGSIAATIGVAVGTTALAVGAAYIDQRYVYPGIFGDKAKRPAGLFQDLPMPTMQSGAKRVISFGLGCRTPVHVGYYNRTIVDVTGSTKAARVAHRELYADVMLILNDRFTFGIEQLYADGKLIWARTRNLVSIRDDQITGVALSGNLLLTATSISGPDMSLVFFESSGNLLVTGVTAVASPTNTLGATGIGTNYPVGAGLRLLDQFGGVVGFFNVTVSTANLLTVTPAVPISFSGGSIDAPAPEVVKLSGWTNGVNGYYKVANATPHGRTPSTMLLVPRGTQTPATCASGSALNPGTIERVDDRLMEPGCLFAGGIINRHATDQDFASVDGSYQVTRIDVGGNSGGLPGVISQMFLFPILGTGTPIAGPVLMGTATAPWTIDFLNGAIAVPGFPAPVLFFGDRAQATPSLMTQTLPASDVPGYRGQALVTMGHFPQTEFGNRIPLFEAVQRPDFTKTYAQVIVDLMGLANRSGSNIDVTGVASQPFRGFYFAGGQPLSRTLQPIMVAASLAAQERGQVLAFFSLKNCDSIQVTQVNDQNGVVVIDDLAAHEFKGTAGGSSQSPSRATVGDVSEADNIPTSIGIQFTDAVNRFADGYEHFGLRHPAGNDHVWHMDVDVRPLLLTHSEAKNLAGTLVRRTKINNEAIDLVLPVAYLDYLENDLLVFSAHGRFWTMRCDMVDVGANYLMQVHGVVEDVTVQIAALPVQPGVGIPPPRTQPPVPLDIALLDIPALSDDDAFSPTIYLAGCSLGGGWAGVRVYLSSDNVTFNLAGVLSTEHLLGHTTTLLGVGGTFGVDTVNTVTVRLDGGNPQPFGAVLTSTNLQGVLNGGNLCVIDNEILAFQTATLNADGTYTLSNLLRGLRDTEDQVAATRAVGGRFVSLNFMILNQLAVVLAGMPYGQQVYYKFVPAGLTLSDVTAKQLAWTGSTLRPFHPGLLSVARDGSNNATVSWEPRPRRQLADQWAGVQNQTEEQVEIFSDGTFATQVRQFALRPGANSNSTPHFFVYMAALQTTDGLTPGNAINFRVYQTTVAGIRSKAAQGTL